MRLIHLITILIFSLTASMAPAQIPPRIGQPVERPEVPTTERPYGFIDGSVVTGFVEEGVFEIRFTTSEPTPPAMAYAGLNDIREGLDYPRFRSYYPEEGEPADMRTEHRIRVDFKSLVRKMPETEFEPRICWRAEVYVPGKKSTRFLEGRVYFDPETLGDTVNVLYGPVVDQVDETSALIVFETDRPAKGQVRIDGRTIASKENVKHAIRVEGLRPDTEYEYRITAGETVVRPYSFKTAGAESFEFAAMVDSREGVGGGMRNSYGVNAFSLYALGSDAYYRGADFMIFPGDLVNGYTTGVDDFRNQLHSFRRIFESVNARVPMWEGMGNHESLVDFYDTDEGRLWIDKAGNESAEAIFAEVFYNPTNGPADEGPGSPTYDENLYYFDWGHARIFILNNNYWWVGNPHKYGGNLEGYILRNQVEWLRRQVALADEEESVKLLFFAAQEPPYPNGGHTRDAMWYNGGDTNRDGEVNDADIDIVENRNEVWEIMSSSPKSVAFIAGDEHAYSRIVITDDTPVGHKKMPDGSEATFKHALWQVTSGGAGAPWYDKELHLPWSPHLAAHSTQPHYAYFKVDGENVDLEVYSQTGEQIDAATLRRQGRNLSW